MGSRLMLSRINWIDVLFAMGAVAAICILVVYGSVFTMLIAAGGLLCAGLTLFVVASNRAHMRYYVTLLLWMIMLSPSINLLPGLAAVRGEEVILFCFGLSFLIHRRAAHEPFSAPPGTRWVIGFGLAIIVSSLLSEYRSFRDAMEVVKVLKYYFLIWIGYNAGFTDDQVKRFMRDVLIAAGLSAAIGVAQFFNWFNINSWFSPLFTTTQLDGIVEYGRVIGTSSNPNQFGLLLLLPLGIGYAVLTFRKGGYRTLRTWAIITIPLAFSALALTGSRTGIFALMGMLFLLVMWPQSGYRLSRRVIFLLVLGATLIGFLHFASDTWVTRMNSLADPLAASTFQKRTIKWQDAIVRVADAPIFGAGPNKASDTGALDNEYLLILVRYGIVGLTLFIGWLLTMFIRSFRSSDATHSRLILRVGVVGAMVGAFVYMITASFFYDLQTMSLFALVIGVALSKQASTTANSDLTTMPQSQ